MFKGRGGHNVKNLTFFLFFVFVFFVLVVFLLGGSHVSQGETEGA